MHVAVELMMAYDFYKGLKTGPKLARDSSHAEEHAKGLRLRRDELHV
jgi:hypothetical protein